MAVAHSMSGGMGDFGHTTRLYTDSRWHRLRCTLWIARIMSKRFASNWAPSLLLDRLMEVALSQAGERQNAIAAMAVDAIGGVKSARKAKRKRPPYSEQEQARADKALALLEECIGCQCMPPPELL